MRCVTLNGGPRITRLLRMSKDESSRKFLLTEQFLWKVNWSTWLEHATEKNFWVLDRNWTHDIPNTRRPLYPLSYENSRSARSFYWIHAHVRVNPCHLSHFITELKNSPCLLITFISHLNSSCSRRSKISMCRSSGVIAFRLINKTQWQMFLLLNSRNVCVPPIGINMVSKYVYRVW